MQFPNAVKCVFSFQWISVCIMKPDIATKFQSNTKSLIVKIESRQKKQKILYSVDYFDFVGKKFAPTKSNGMSMVVWNVHMLIPYSSDLPKTISLPPSRHPTESSMAITPILQGIFGLPWWLHSSPRNEFLRNAGCPPLLFFAFSSTISCLN